MGEAGEYNAMQPQHEALEGLCALGQGSRGHSLGYLVKLKTVQTGLGSHCTISNQRGWT